MLTEYLQSQKIIAKSKCRAVHYELQYEARDHKIFHELVKLVKFHNSLHA